MIAKRFSSHGLVLIPPKIAETKLLSLEPIASLYLKMDAWNTFLLGPGLFSGAFAVSFRECFSDHQVQCKIAKGRGGDAVLKFGGCPNHLGCLNHERDKPPQMVVTSFAHNTFHPWYISPTKTMQQKMLRRF